MKRVTIMLLAMTAWSQPPPQPESEPVDEPLSPTTCVAICNHDLPVTALKIDLDSDFYNTLNRHMTDYGFALIKNNENSVIYRNDEKLLLCNIIFQRPGKIRVFLIQHTNRPWHQSLIVVFRIIVQYMAHKLFQH
ncbi:MAG: hypothetical protein K2H33_07190 [Muribaculaceae bacterium]|nr:hypothetical protein [Muribaculaceae bacterium]